MLPRLTRRKAGRVLLAGLLLGVIGTGLWAAARPILANHYRRQAEKALQKQRYPQALEAYQKALRYQPGSADLHLLAARTARRSGDLPAAREYLRRCRELQGGVTEEQQLEGYLLRAQSGELNEVHAQLVPYLVEEGPLTPLVLEGLARAYMGRYQADLAWRCLYRWNQLEPDNVEVLFRRGTWYAQQQNGIGAAEDYGRALELDPERIDIRLAYAEIIRSDKKFTEVEEQYRIVLRQSPQNADARLGLAQAYVELGRLDDAREQIGQIPADKRDAGDYFWIRGLVELRSGHADAAEPLLRQALERDPRNLDACYSLLLCLHRLGRADDAAQMRARFEQMERDQKRLIQLTTQEFQAQPASAELRCELAEIYLRMSLHERGMHWLHVALKLDPNFRRAHELLRDHFDAMGGPDAAEKADFHRRQLANLR